MPNQELVMETTHGRKGKCKTEFKAVVNKVMVSGLVLAAIMSSTIMPAMAASGNIKDSIKETYKNIENYETAVNEESHIVTQAKAAPMVSSFWDVKQGEWFYDSVMKMTQMGYFAGKGTNENGEATFAPNDTMTKAEFLTVVARILYGEENLKGVEGDAWWSVYYTALVNGGVISTSEFKVDDIEKPMTRQEMSLVAVRALQQRGENTKIADANIVEKAIPDYQLIGTYYRDYVVKGYKLGLLCGNDDYGTFSPRISLNRASATMVLYRIVEPSVRIQKDFSQVTAQPETQGPITIKEGEVSVRRFAKEGDIVIKADGTQVVLKKGPHGVLGEGQGVAPDLGVINDDFKVTAKNLDGVTYAGGGGYKDSTGEWIKNQDYFINELTGEGHWYREWATMTSRPTTNGTFHYQLSADKNWMWMESHQEWAALYVQDIADAGFQMILEANGL